MKTYICTNCNYRFKATNPKECPYCGKNTLEKEKTAEELVEEINKLLEED